MASPIEGLTQRSGEVPPPPEPEEEESDPEPEPEPEPETPVSRGADAVGRPRQDQEPEADPGPTGAVRDPGRTAEDPGPDAGPDPEPEPDTDPDITSQLEEDPAMGPVRDPGRVEDPQTRQHREDVAEELDVDPQDVDAVGDTAEVTPLQPVEGDPAVTMGRTATVPVTRFDVDEEALDPADERETRVGRALERGSAWWQDRATDAGDFVADTVPGEIDAPIATVRAPDGSIHQLRTDEQLGDVAGGAVETGISVVDPPGIALMVGDAGRAAGREAWDWQTARMDAAEDLAEMDFDEFVGEPTRAAGLGIEAAVAPRHTVERGRQATATGADLAAAGAMQMGPSLIESPLETTARGAGAIGAAFGAPGAATRTGRLGRDLAEPRTDVPPRGLMGDERAQLDLGGLRRRREPDTVDIDPRPTSPDFDPRVFEDVGRRPSGRVDPDDVVPDIGTRPPRSDLDARRDFARRVRDAQIDTTQPVLTDAELAAGFGVAATPTDVSTPFWAQPEAGPGETFGFDGAFDPDEILGMDTETAIQAEAEQQLIDEDETIVIDGRQAEEEVIDDPAFEDPETIGTITEPDTVEDLREGVGIDEDVAQREMERAMAGVRADTAVGTRPGQRIGQDAAQRERTRIRALQQPVLRGAQRQRIMQPMPRQPARRRPIRPPRFDWGDEDVFDDLGDDFDRGDAMWETGIAEPDEIDVDVDFDSEFDFGLDSDMDWGDGSIDTDWFDSDDNNGWF